MNINQHLNYSPISMLAGEVREIGAEVITVMANGVGYDVLADPQTRNKIRVGRQVELFVFHRSGPLGCLFIGFLNSEERDIFRSVISIVGIGSATADTLACTIGMPDLLKAAKRNDEALIATIPGIGPKKARQIVDAINNYLKRADEIRKIDNLVLTSLQNSVFDECLDILKESETDIDSAIKKIEQRKNSESGS